MSEVLVFLGEAKPILGAGLCLIGAILAIIGTVGVLRFPDFYFYTRLHAASVTDTAAATLLIVGMMLLAPDWLIAFKLLAVWLFLFLTGPTAGHALANAAHTAGLEPLIGRQGRGDGDDDEGEA